MKRSLWFDASMLALILVAAMIGSTRDRGPHPAVTASTPSSSLASASPR